MKARFGFVQGALVRTLVAAVACAAFAVAHPLAAGARGVLAAPATRVLPANGLEVLTHDGWVRGKTLDGMSAFLGIPYAQPPVGSLRWRAPQPHPPWASPLDARHFGSPCPQVKSPFGVKSSNEDCLFLNVFLPQNSSSTSRRLPVMVWIHGGGFVVGASNLYDPNRIVPQGVIVVTINYRLGLLGFFAQSALDAEPGLHVNYGLMDQQLALAWVRRNIAAFGGDPGSMTVFGESAGGLSVFSQLASPLANGLFDRAIIESGSYQIAALPSLQTSEATGNALAMTLGCSNERVKCLRGVPVSALLAQTPSEETPTIDGKLLPTMPATAFAQGTFNRVPVIDGTNHDEFRLFIAEDFDLGANGPVQPAQYAPLLQGEFGSLAPKVLRKYPLANYPSPDLALATLLTDYVFSCQALSANDSLSQWVPTFAYEFYDENAPEEFLPPVSFPYGSAHASELQFFWDEFSHSEPSQLSSIELQLAAQMISYWTTFAATSNPNGSSTSYWPYFVGNYDDVNSFVPPTPGVVRDFSKEHNCNFWKPFPPPAFA
jgi:para-nitrobenzyl esterase